MFVDQILKATAVVCMMVLLSGCVPASLGGNTTFVLIISLFAIVVAGWQFLRDRCAFRCERKSQKLEQELDNHVRKYHGKKKPT